MSMTPGRIVGIAVGAIAILGIGVYGPAMLLGPLPSVSVTVTERDEAPDGIPDQGHVGHQPHRGPPRRVAGL